MPGLVGKKIGMTSIFNENGKNVPVTLIELGPCTVTQIRTVEKDGYNAVQVGYGDSKEKNTTKAKLGHLSASKCSPKYKLVEFNDFENEVKLGESLGLTDVFAEGEFVDIVGYSKGKGFQGVVKRYNFRGVGDATHGQHNRDRAPGSIGACSTPSRVFKGMRMGGRMGNDRVKVQNLKIVKVLADKNVLVVGGSIPGAKNAYIIVEK